VTPRSGSGAEERRRPVRDQVLADLDGLLERVMADLARQSSSEGPSDQEISPLDAGFLAWMLAWLLDLWVDGSSPVGLDLEPVRAEATQAAYSWIPLAAARGALRLAPSTLMVQVRAAAAGRLEPVDFAELVEVILEASGQLGEVYEIAYHVESARLAQTMDGARARLVHDIVAGNQGSMTTFEQRSAAVDLELPTSPIVLAIVVDRATMEAPDQASLDDLVLSATDPAEGSLAGRGPLWGTVHRATGDDLSSDRRDVSTGVLVAPEGALPRLSELIEVKRWWAAAARVVAWPECSREFRKARSALRAAPPWAFADRRVLVNVDVQALALIGAPCRPPAAALATLVLGSLLEPDQVELLAALEAYLATGSAPLAARQLDLSPGTVRRRLREAHTITGLDPRLGWDRFVLGLATTAGSAAS
jgi:hypothetical protein